MRLTYVYQWVVTSGLAIGTIFELGVLYELCDKLFLSGLHFWADLRKAFSWIAALLLLSASVISALLARLELARAMAVFQTLDFSANQSGENRPAANAGSLRQGTWHFLDRGT